MQQAFEHYRQNRLFLWQYLFISLNNLSKVISMQFEHLFYREENSTCLDGEQCMAAIWEI